MENHRQVQRKRSFLGAQLQFGNGTQVYDCLIRNISDQGARIAFENTAALPARFTLSIPQKGARHDARIIWRSFDSAGIEFLDTITAKTRIPSLTIEAGY